MNDRQEIIITNNLKDLRKKHELSQEELADKLGISRQSINNYHKGDSMPKDEVLKKLKSLIEKWK